MAKINELQAVHNEVTTGEPLEKGGYFVGYNYVVRNAIKVFDLNSGEYSCLIMLLSYAGADKDKCFPSQSTLAKDLNVGDRAVRKYLDGLQNKGVINIYNTYNKDGQKTKNVYDISPCLNKIREIYCASEDTTNASKNMKIVKKPRRNGQEQMNLSNSTDRNNHSWGTGTNEPTTNNNIQVTNIKDLEEDKAKVPSQAMKQSLDISQESAETIISEVLASFKDDLQPRTASTLKTKALRKVKEGAIHTDFHSYFLEMVTRKLEELENRRKKESEAKSSQPNPSKRTVRKEQLPEWFGKEDQQSQEPRIEVIDLEEERRLLEEELKIYQKA